MLNVVFTGKAIVNGEHIKRDHLVLCAQAAGFTVQDKVYPDTNLLVASRDDTKKAAFAAKRKITVVGYEKFMDALAPLVKVS